MKRLGCVLVCVTLFVLFWGIVYAFDNPFVPVRATPSHTMRLTPPVCGTIVRVDGSILCTNSGLEPTDAELSAWVKTHRIEVLTR